MLVYSVPLVITTLHHISYLDHKSYQAQVISLHTFYQISMIFCTTVKCKIDRIQNTFIPSAIHNFDDTKMQTTLHNCFKYLSHQIHCKYTLSLFILVLFKYNTVMCITQSILEGSMCNLNSFSLPELI